jgi:hypothetical protein
MKRLFIQVGLMCKQLKNKKLTRMKKLIYPFIFVFAFSTTALAQSNITQADTAMPFKNSFYVEFGGASLLGLTANYERFLSKQPGGFSVRAGLGGGYLPGIFDDGQLFAALPLGISYNIPISRNKRNLIEIGGTYSFIYAGGDYDNTQFISPILGFRYESPLGKFQLRATLMPVLYSTVDKSIADIPWFGFSIGTKF